MKTIVSTTLYPRYYEIRDRIVRIGHLKLIKKISYVKYYIFNQLFLYIWISWTIRCYLYTFWNIYSVLSHHQIKKTHIELGFIKTHTVRCSSGGFVNWKYRHKICIRFYCIDFACSHFYFFLALIFTKPIAK